jgi:hypothetical protein
MFKIFRYFYNKTFTRPIQAFKFDFNLKVSIIELFELESNSEKFDSSLKKMVGQVKKVTLASI